MGKHIALVGCGGAQPAGVVAGKDGNGNTRTTVTGLEAAAPEHGAPVFTFDTVDIAESFTSRLFGLMGKQDIPDGYCILFPRCTSVHTAFMRCPIDVLYIRMDGRMVGYETLTPWKLGHAPIGTQAVVECRAGTMRKHGIDDGEPIMLREL